MNETDFESFQRWIAAIKKRETSKQSLMAIIIDKLDDEEFNHIAYEFFDLGIARGRTVKE